MRRSVRLLTCAATGTAVVLATLGASTARPLAPPAQAAGVAQDVLPSAVPSLSTPEVRDGKVQALALVGDVVVLGGTFSSVSDRGADPVPRSRVAAYDRRTGALVPGFAPAVAGEVTALLPGPRPGTVYVGGAFTRVDGRAAPRVALLDVSTGAAVPGFRSPPVDRPVASLARSGDRLLLGGTFTKVGGAPHAGLAALDATTGALDPTVAVQFRGHHNAGHVPGAVSAATGVRDLATSPDGRTLVAVGNFRTADGLARDQLAVVDLGDRAVVRRAWATTALADPCAYGTFDSWVRDVDVAPDGQWFVVGSTGGRNQGLCDAVARFPLTATGNDVAPTWVAASGQDSIYSVATSGAAVYAGGHFRWFNNPEGVESAGAGAVPRPGLVALDPATGLPLPWNPGRHPRDKGAFVLLPTDRELLMGTDTEWVGDREYLTPRLTSFPLAGGTALPPTAHPGLPASISRVVTTRGGGTQLVTQQLTASGTVTGPVRTTAPAGLSGVRAAAVLGGRASLLMADGRLLTRSWDGRALGPATVLDAYDDPHWADVKTGLDFGRQTYRGLDSGLARDSADVTAAFAGDGRLFYVLDGSTRLFSRAFEGGTGITSAQVTPVPGVELPAVTGLTWAGGYLFFSRASDGALVRQGFDGTRTTSAPVVVSSPRTDGTDWRGAALFAGPAS